MFYCSYMNAANYIFLLYFVAAGSGHLNCLKWLIDNGTDCRLNYVTYSLASHYTLTDIIVSITNNLKESPLDVAKKYGKTHCIALIEKGPVTI